jgi:hypothetical protein
MLTASDLQVRFDVGSFQLSQEHLLKAPKAIRCDARIGRLPLSFDLVLLETLERSSLVGTRGRSLPTFSYNGGNLAFRGSTTEFTFDSVLGEELRFTLPYALRELAGPDTMYQITVHVGNQWFISGFEKFEQGIVTLELGRRR